MYIGCPVEWNPLIESAVTVCYCNLLHLKAGFVHDLQLSDILDTW